MAVHMISVIKEYIGESGDTKPTPEFPGSTFHELDTGDTYIWDNVNWVLDTRLIKALSDAFEL